MLPIDRTAALATVDFGVSFESDFGFGFLLAWHVPEYKSNALHRLPHAHLYLRVLRNVIHT